MIRIGKKGITESVILEVKRHLITKKLVKIKVLNSNKLEYSNIVETLLKETNSKLISSIGHTFVLYKPRER